jgi:hypothetical protein
LDRVATVSARSVSANAQTAVYIASRSENHLRPAPQQRDRDDELDGFSRHRTRRFRIEQYPITSWIV